MRLKYFLKFLISFLLFCIFILPLQVQAKPDYAEAHYNLGLTYLTLKDSGSALEQYKILKNLDNDLANKLFNLIYK